MKKSFLLLILIVLIFSPHAVNAAAPTPTASASPTTQETLDKKLTEQINNLKEKIASRVSELNLVEKRGIIGIISEVSGDKITITDVLDKTRIIDVDEITKFSSSSAKESFGLSDLKKGTRISALGLYNKQSKRILARFVDTTVDPIFISGAISDLDKDSFYATVTTTEGKKIKLDVQTTTKTNSYDGEELIKSGFSKLQIGNRIIAIGYPDKNDPKLIVANRVVVLPTLAKNPKIIISIPSPTKESSTPTPTPIKSGQTKKPTPTP